MSSNQGMQGVGSVGGAGDSGRSRGAQQIGAASQRDSSTASNNSFADSLSKSLTSGGKEKFESPGAQKDFESGMRSAVNNMIEGGKSGDKEQMMKGITELLSLISGLSSAKGKKGGEEEGGAEKGGGGSGAQGAQGAQGSGPASGAQSSDGDKKKKLMELIQMLMSMGVSPEMISQLLESMGIPAEEAQQMMNQAKQQESQGDSTNQAMMPKQALPA